MQRPARRQGAGQNQQSIKKVACHIYGFSSQDFQKKPMDQVQLKGMISQKDQETIGKPYFQREKEYKGREADYRQRLPDETDPVVQHFFYKNLFVYQKRLNLILHPDRCREQKKEKQGRQAEPEKIGFSGNGHDPILISGQNYAHQKQTAGIKPPVPLKQGDSRPAHHTVSGEGDLEGGKHQQADGRLPD